MSTEEERENAWREIETVREALAGAPGAELMRDLSALARSRRIFDGNENELQAYLVHLGKPEVWLPIQDRRHPERFERMLDEVDRRFHNFLAADFSLVQQTMAFRNDHVREKLPVLAADYQARTPNSPIVRFVHELRVIAQHWRLPLTESSLHFERGEHDDFLWEHTLRLDRRGLLKRRWRDPIAKEYFDTLEDNPALGPLVRDYARGQRAFSDWFVTAFIQARDAEFAEFLQLQERLSRAAAVLQPPD